MVQDLGEVRSSPLVGDTIMRLGRQRARLSWTFGKAENDNLWGRVAPSHWIVSDAPAAILGARQIKAKRLSAMAPRAINAAVFR